MLYTCLILHNFVVSFLDCVDGEEKTNGSRSKLALAAAAVAGGTIAVAAAPVAIAAAGTFTPRVV